MLISRGTAPEQPVEWAHSSKIANEFSRILIFLYKICEF